MSQKISKVEFDNIKKEFINIDKYNEMKYIFHHGDSRINHIERVAKLSFYCARIFNLDYVSTTRGAFLHDFFIEDDVNKKEYKKYLRHHPYIALSNAKEYFVLNDLEEDIIKKHMFPITLRIPKYKETVLVGLCDKIISIYELIRYETKFSLAFAVVLFFNMLD